MSTQPQLCSVPFLSAFIGASVLSTIVIAGLLGGPQLSASIAAFLSLPLWVFVLVSPLIAVLKATRAKDLQGSSLPAQPLAEVPVPVKPCLFHQNGTACCLPAGHNGLHLFKCASSACPGLSWPASARPHPQSCLATTEATDVQMEWTRTFSVTFTAAVHLDQRVIDHAFTFQETPYDYTSEDIVCYVAHRLILGIPLSRIVYFSTLPDALAEITDVVVENVTEDTPPGYYPRTSSPIITVEKELRPWGVDYTDEECRRAVGSGRPLDEILDVDVELPIGGGKSFGVMDRLQIGAQWLARHDRQLLILWAVDEVLSIPDRDPIPEWDVWVEAGCPARGAAAAIQATTRTETTASQAAAAAAWTAVATTASATSEQAASVAFLVATLMASRADATEQELMPVRLQELMAAASLERLRAVIAGVIDKQRTGVDKCPAVCKH